MNFGDFSKGISKGEPFFGFTFNDPVISEKKKSKFKYCPLKAGFSFSMHGKISMKALSKTAVSLAISTIAAQTAKPPRQWPEQPYR